MVNGQRQNIFVAQIKIAEIKLDSQQCDITSSGDGDLRGIFRIPRHIHKIDVSTVGETCGIKICKGVGRNDINSNVARMHSRTRHLYRQLIVGEPGLSVERLTIFVHAGQRDIDRGDAYAVTFRVKRSYKADIMLILLFFPIIVTRGHAKCYDTHNAVFEYITKFHCGKSFLKECMPSGILNKIFVTLDFVGRDGPEVHLI